MKQVGYSMRKKALLLLLALCFLLPSPGRAEAAGRKLTLMVYMCGSNLESGHGYATRDLREMMRSGFPEEDVSVIVMIGGSSTWALHPALSDTMILEIGKNSQRTVRDPIRQNMGESETLTDLLVFGRENYPAERYALILWDHGGGPLGGLCWDEQYDADHLTLQELSAALASAGLDREPLAWIGFDACLMSSVEVAAAVAPYAGYMISSQAEEPHTGWNYSFLKGLAEDTDAPETGRRIIDAYFSGQEESARDLTLACIDLSAVGRVVTAMDVFYADLTSRLTPESFADISRMRLSATGFGRAGDTQPGESGYDLVDLVSLTESYAPQNPDAAEDVIRAVRNAVVFQRSNVPGTGGLSVYHPYRNRESFRSEWQETYASLQAGSGYAQYVSLYGSIMIGDRLVSWKDLDRLLALTDKAEKGGTPVTRISLELSEEQAAGLASARLVILGRNLYDDADDSYFRLYSSADVRMDGTVLSASYDGSNLQAVHENAWTPLTGALSYRITEDGTYIIPVYPVDEESGRSKTPLLAEYRPDEAGRLRFADFLVWDDMTGTWSSRAETDLSGYASVTFMNDYRVLTCSDAGEILPFDEWTIDAHPDTWLRGRYDVEYTSFGLDFARDLDRAESLYAAFELTDTQGNVRMSSLVPLEEGGVRKIPASVTVAGLPADMPEVVCSAFLLPSGTVDSSRIVLNVTMTNTTDRDLSFLLTDVRLNGRKTDIGALSARGTGQEDHVMRNALAPGETGAASLTLRWDDIQALMPDVSLQDISFSLSLSEVAGGTSRLLYTLPAAIRTSIPLDSFCPDAAVLPSPELIRFGQEIGALDEFSAKTLFSGGGCTVSLAGIWVTDGHFVLLLRCSNDSSVSRHLFLGAAAADGKEAVLGQEEDVLVQIRNNRVRTYHLPMEAWNAPAGVSVSLEPGESCWDYVTLTPAAADQAPVRTLSFRAFVYNEDSSSNAVHFSEALIAAEEAIFPGPGLDAVAPAVDYTVTEGTPVPAESARALSTTSFAVQEPSFRPAVIRLPETEESAVTGLYVLVRRVSSDADLAAMDVENRSLSFSDGREWLIYELIGDLLPGEDSSLSGIFPGLLPAVRIGSSALPVTPVYMWADENGSFVFDEFSNHTDFNSLVFPGAVLTAGVGSVSLQYDPLSGNGRLISWKENSGSWPSLGGLLVRRIWMIPADSEEQDLLNFFLGNFSAGPDISLHQLGIGDPGDLSFTLEPLADPENHAVLLIWQTEEGVFRCSGPVPLTSFLE